MCMEEGVLEAECVDILLLYSLVCKTEGMLL